MGRMDDYVEVNERIEKFYKEHPEGSLRCKEWSVVEANGQTFFVYVAQAFRTPHDEAPAEGIAWEPVPGKTNFTRDSESMNAETSAWGRAIAALGFETKRGIASANEVRSRQQPKRKPKPKAEPDHRHKLVELAKARFGGEVDAIKAWIKEETGKDSSAELTEAETNFLIGELSA